MECKKCGRANSDDAIFCGSCGNDLKHQTSESSELECPKCGKVNATGSLFCESCGNKLVFENADFEEKRKCPSCSTENNQDAQFCNKCGSSLTSTSNNVVVEKTTNQSVNVDKLIWKIICMIGGIVGAAIGGYIVYSDKNAWFGYTYEPPFTDHEIGIIILIVASIIVFIIGCCISIHSNNQD